MNNPVEMRLVDEEAPTTIDRTVCIAPDAISCGVELPAVHIGSRPTTTVERRRWLLGAAFAALLVGGALGAFIRQRAVSTQLRWELAALEQELDAIRLTMKSTSEDSKPPAPRIHPVDLANLDRSELEHHAVDALVDSDFARALGYYEALSDSAPDESVFSDFVSVVRMKARCSGTSNREVDACR